MNKLKLIIEIKTESDMGLIADYIAKDNKDAAVKMLNYFINILINYQNIQILGLKDLILHIKM